MNQETKQLTAQQWSMYIGQEIQYPGADDEMIVATLTGVSKSEGLETTYKKRKAGEPSGDIISFKSNGWHNSDALHAKLLLRPLSDISEEEMIEVGKITMPGRVLDPEDIKDALETAKAKGMAALGFADVSALVVFQVTAYLLSRGFDLFNWIDQGLALDKTKTPTN